MWSLPENGQVLDHWTLLEVEKVEDEVLQEEESIIIMIIYINIK